ncbi:MULTISPECIES: DUF3297 family protein [unclassified Aureimonas]|uniref:DUF3297 family protein n=1 Tax=unclassified Aureimonas TaxID=2615206 RepID=UPI0006FC1804|nr:MULTISPECIES: DUF3297 family protein [unclassified Aureimonas]KQT52540.1 glutathione peroxidase [Aureimonas sp. Leaf427]KQT77559.1 glutathione peroxidase [Aureimonas sp. Leaf460]
MTETPDQTPDQIVDETAIALPDRLAADPSSPFHDPELLARGVGVRFKGVEKTNVEEYCVSEGWIRVPAGNARDRKGNPMTLKLKGPVEVWLREPGEA